MRHLGKVSVVIPTYRRPVSLEKAIASALDQTMRPFEVIVVSDGPDADAQAVVRSFNEASVRFSFLDTNRGAGAARNKGIVQAAGDYIAFLDDDDFWYRDKLKRQLETIETVGRDNVLVGCLEERISTDGRKLVYPSVMPFGGDTVMHYQFYPDRQGRSKGIHTSTWLGSVDLFREIPFREELPRHQDWQWIIDAYQYSNPKILMVPEVLAVQKVPPNLVRRSATFQYTYGWYKRNKELLPSYARCSILSLVAKKVGSRGSVSGCLSFIRELWRQRCVNEGRDVLRLGDAVIRGLVRNTGRKFLMAMSRLSGRLRNSW